MQMTMLCTYSHMHTHAFPHNSNSRTHLGTTKCWLIRPVKLAVAPQMNLPMTGISPQRTWGHTCSDSIRKWESEKQKALSSTCLCSCLREKIICNVWNWTPVKLVFIFIIRTTQNLSTTGVPYSYTLGPSSPAYLVYLQHVCLSLLNWTKMNKSAKGYRINM